MKNMKKKRTVQSLILSCTLLFFNLIFIGHVLALENNDVPVSYHVVEKEKYSLKVSVSGNGVVLDGAQKISNGTNEYKVSENEEKIFEIIPDSNSKLESISWKIEKTNEDITQKLVTFTENENKKVKLKGLSENSKLEIKFSSSSRGESVNNKKGNNLPKTGEKESVLFPILGVGLLILIIFMRMRRYFKLEK